MNDTELLELINELKGFGIEVSLRKKLMKDGVVLIVDGKDMIATNQIEVIYSLLSMMLYGYKKAKINTPILCLEDVEEIGEILYMYGDMHLEEYDEGDKEWDEFKALEDRVDQYRRKLR